MGEWRRVLPDEWGKQTTSLTGRRCPGIHPASFVDPQAELHPTVEIGPGAVIGPHVRLGPHVRIGAHAVLTGYTEIERDVQIHTGATVGEDPQDRAFRGGRSYVRIGSGTRIREYVTIHRGTKPESETWIGANCFVMATAHVAHNCRIGDGVSIANGALLAGHVEVADHALISGNAAIHQFVRIGRRALIGGCGRVPRDVPPFTMVRDEQACGLNLVGLRRAGVPRAAVAELQRLYGMFARRDRQLADRLDEIAAHVTTDEGREFIEFLRTPGKRGIATFLARRGGA